MMIFLADHPGVESEEVADNIVLAYDKDNQVVAIEIVGGARELFAELVDKTRLEAEPAARVRRKASKPA